jgi:hypothetical protein
MLAGIRVREGNQTFQINDRLHLTDRLTEVFGLRMLQLEAVHRWLAAYLQGAAILIQIPGAANYRYQEDGPPAELEAPIRHATPRICFDVLAATFQRLDVEPLLREVPGVEGFERRTLSVEARIRLAECDRQRLLRIAAECLDRLLVEPHLTSDCRPGCMVIHRPGPEPPEKAEKKKRRTTRRKGARR